MGEPSIHLLKARLQTSADHFTSDLRRRFYPDEIRFGKPAHQSRKMSRPKIL
jgi:hypothetical protein